MPFETDIESFISEELAKIKNQIDEDPLYHPPTISNIRNLCYQAIGKRISADALQKRIKIIIGEADYKRFYTKGLTPEVDNYLHNCIDRIKQNCENKPDYASPSIRDIQFGCLNETGEKVAFGTVRKRLQKLLGEEIYYSLYEYRISNEAESFLAREIPAIKARLEAEILYNPPTLGCICNKCREETGKEVSEQAVKARLIAELGEQVYAKNYLGERRRTSRLPQGMEDLLSESIAEIVTNLAADTSYIPSSPSELKKKFFLETDQKISTGTIRNRLIAALGEEKYAKEYVGRPAEKLGQNRGTLRIGERIDKEKTKQSNTIIIQTLNRIKEQVEQTPLSPPPPFRDIQESCAEALGKNIDSKTIRNRLRQILGNELYEAHYGRKANKRKRLPQKVEFYLDRKLSEIKYDLTHNAAAVPPKAQAIRSECYTVTERITSVVTIRQRLRNTLGDEMYNTYYARDAQNEANQMLANEIGEIKDHLSTILSYFPPTVDQLRERIVAKTAQNISPAIIRRRMKASLGAKSYQDFYGKGLEASIEGFLQEKIGSIREELEKHTLYIPPTIAEIENECFSTIGKVITPQSLQRRLQRELTQPDYERFYVKGLSKEAEKFIVDRIAKIKKGTQDNPHFRPLLIKKMREQCIKDTGKAVSTLTLARRLEEGLGTDLYQKLYGHKVSAEEYDLIRTWTLKQAQYLQAEQCQQVQSMGHLARKMDRSSETIRTHAKLVLEEVFGTQWKQIYDQWTMVYKDNRFLGTLNHAFFERLAQRGHAELRGKYPSIPPSFREVKIPGKRHDLILPDAYKEGYLRDCLSVPLLNERTLGSLMNLPSEGVNRFADVILDFTTRHSRKALGEKAEKYCDGRTLLIMTCTGEFPADSTGLVVHPDYPDAVGMPAALAFKFLQMNELYIFTAYQGVQLTQKRDMPRLQEFVNILKRPGEAEYQTYEYENYCKNRNLNERRAIEQIAIQTRARSEGQRTLDKFPQLGTSTPEIKIKDLFNILFTDRFIEVCRDLQKSTKDGRRESPKSQDPLREEKRNEKKSKQSENSNESPREKNNQRTEQNSRELYGNTTPEKEHQ